MFYKVYRNNNLFFNVGGKQYSKHIINVTFKYANKEFNKYYGNKYVKFGYNADDLEFNDCIAFDNNKIVGIQTGRNVVSPVPTELLGDYFDLQNNQYVVTKPIPTTSQVDKLRSVLYNDGFYCDGIKYVRWKRSSGSSRVGKCLFINEALYNRMHKWEMCGLNIQDGDEVDLAALESYISLPSSSIIDTMKINANNILVIDDYESVFKDNVISTYEHSGELVTEEKRVEIRNSIWDGQSLINKDMISHGMVLLRNLFFKSCCFACDIQQFFKDNNITTVSQLNGQTTATKIEDIKLITTPSSIKYLKFGDLDGWINNIDQDFGVVKYDKPTHYFDGRMVQTHYQLLNTLQLSVKDMQEFLAPSFSYLTGIKEDPAIMKYHIKFAIKDEIVFSTANNKKEIIYNLLSINDKFSETKLYQDFKRETVVRPFIKNMRKGHILVGGNYSTLCGNPIEMLLSVVGKFDGQSQIGVGNIHSKRFEYGKTILGSRSPHVCQGNILLATNVADNEIDKYMRLSNEIVCINSINENILMRLSGCDFDSDTIMLTDNEILIRAAKKNYENFKVPTCSVQAKKIKRHYTLEDKCDLDIKTAKNLIGEIVNLSQELNSLLWDCINNNRNDVNLNELYMDICQLDVMSGLEIDAAKKEFPINNGKELTKLRKKYLRLSKEGLPIKPLFFKYLAKFKGYFIKNTKSYLKYDTSMDYLQYCINSYQIRSKKNKIKPFSYVLNMNLYKSKKISYRQVNKIIENIRKANKSTSAIYKNKHFSNNEKFLLYQDIKKECVESIDSLKLNNETMIYLLLLIENEKFKDVKTFIFYTLFSCANNSFYDVLNKSVAPLSYLEENDYGEVQIYEFLFKKLQK